MAIGGGLAINTDHKLAIYNGSIVFSAGYGLAFGDGTVQTTAFTGTAATSWGTIQGTISSQTDLANSLAAKADLAGATFTGKVNFTSVDGAAGLNVGIGGTDTAATAQGDMWIATSGSTLNYRDGLGSWRILAARNLSNTFTVPQIVDTTATSPALRVTQKGTGLAIRIEDENTPDTSATIVDNKGFVGIQVDPSVTLDHALVVGGDILASNFRAAAGSSYYFGSGNSIDDISGQGASPFSGSLNTNDYPDEIEIKAAGTTYRIPARIIPPPSV
jgi:hypothetical protein